MLVAGGVAGGGYGCAGLDEAPSCQPGSPRVRRVRVMGSSGDHRVAAHDLTPGTQPDYAK